MNYMLKPLVPKSRPDISLRLKDITNKPVPAKMKPIADVRGIVSRRRNSLDILQCKHC